MVENDDNIVIPKSRRDVLMVKNTQIFCIMSSLRDFDGRVYRLFFYHNANPLGFEMSQLEIIIEPLNFPKRVIRKPLTCV